MTKHEIREYAFLLLYETLVRTDWNGDLEELYQSTEEMVELPIPTQVKRYVHQKAGGRAGSDHCVLQ